MMREVKRFKAYDDAGVAYVLVLYQDYVAFNNSKGRVVVESGGDLLTDDGQPVNTIAKGRYSIVAAGGNINVRCDDPDAPQ